MTDLKCFVCGGVIEQDTIEKLRYAPVYTGCHCAGCGIKYKPNLVELTKVFKVLHEARRREAAGELDMILDK